MNWTFTASAFCRWHQHLVNWQCQQASGQVRCRMGMQCISPWTWSHEIDCLSGYLTGWMMVVKVLCAVVGAVCIGWVVQCYSRAWVFLGGQVGLAHPSWQVAGRVGLPVKYTMMVGWYMYMAVNNKCSSMSKQLIPSFEYNGQAARIEQVKWLLGDTRLCRMMGTQTTGRHTQ